MHESEKWKWSRSVCLTLSDPMDCSLPGSSAHGIFQARVLEWVAIAFSTAWASYCHLIISYTILWVKVLVFQSCLTLFPTPWTKAHKAPLVHGISEARILEWVAISCSRGSSWLRDRTYVSCVSCITGILFIHWVAGASLVYIIIHVKLYHKNDIRTQDSTCPIADNYNSCKLLLIHSQQMLIDHLLHAKCCSK